jgi:hypothetical protein
MNAAHTRHSPADCLPARRFHPWAVAVGLWLLAAGCAAPPDRGLWDDNPANLLRAVRRAADGRDAAAPARLVELLGHDDPAVRLYAIGALRRLAGTDLGYRCYDDEHTRAAAHERWRQWLAQQAGAVPTSRPALVGGG